MSQHYGWWWLSVAAPGHQQQLHWLIPIITWPCGLWLILARNDINFSMATGLIRLHIQPIGKTPVRIILWCPTTKMLIKACFLIQPLEQEGGYQKCCIFLYSKVFINHFYQMKASPECLNILIYWSKYWVDRLRRTIRKKVWTGIFYQQIYRLCHFILHQVALIDWIDPSGKQHEQLTGVCGIIAAKSNVKTFMQVLKFVVGMFYCGRVAFTIFKHADIKGVRQCLTSKTSLDDRYCEATIPIVKGHHVT